MALQVDDGHILWHNAQNEKGVEENEYICKVVREPAELV